MTKLTQHISIVAITGVGGTPFMSWQHKSGGMWLRDFLPRDIPKARVFTYGYSSKLLNSASYARLTDYADAFLDEIDGLIMRNTQAVCSAIYRRGALEQPTDICLIATTSYSYGT